MSDLAEALEDNRRLQRVVGDLMALSARHGVWAGLDVEAVADDLADTIIRSLELEFVLVRLLMSDGQTIERLRTREPIDAAAEAQVIEAIRDGTADPARATREIIHPADQRTLRVAVAPLGPDGGCGTLSAVCDNPGFPGDRDRLFLDAAATHVAIVMQRRQADERLRDSEERKSAVIENALDCIITIDHEGTILEFNSAAERTFGHRREDVLGKELADVIVPSDWRARHRAGLERYRRTGEPHVLGRRLEVPALRADGTTFPAELAITQITREGPLQFTAHLRDISDRNALQASLSASEARFRSLMEQAPFSVQIFSPDGRTVDVNGAWEALWGVSLPQIADYNILHDEQLRAEGVLQHIERAFAGEVSFVPPIRYDPELTIPDLSRHDDAARWVSAVAYPLKDETGAVREVVLVHDDITDRKRAEAAVHESEEKLRLLADTIPQLAWMAQPDGNIFWYNRRWYEYTGTTPDQMVGWGWQSVHHPDILPGVIERWSGSLASGEPFDMVFPIRGADGTFRSFLTRVNPLRGVTGEVLYWFGTNTDVSEMMRMEAALRDADRRKDEFLATLAHELRNPLAPIRNSLEILKMPRVEPKLIQQTRAMMERQLDHLVRLVDDLLDVSRVMRGTIELRRERVEAAAVVARAVETVQPTIDEREHRLHLTVSPESLLLDADPVRLVQALANLLLNAAKYTDPGGDIELHAEGDGNEVVLTVRDNGVGIPGDMLGRVFDLFLQLDHGANRAQGGLGIGLTLVRNLVEMHGGSVTARSAGLGRGSEFEIRIPRAQSDRRATPRDGEPVTAADRPASSGLRLLVVDDNEDAATSLSILLELQGHEVRMVHDGPSALDTVATYRPDLIFLDLGMPGMDGYEVARQLRQQRELEGTVIAALTGWGQEEDRRRTRAAGFDHHLVKPPEPAELTQILTELARRKDS